MKVTDFINSKSIAKYLESINYQFNAQEAAFVVWQSNATNSKKYSAWQEIIDTFADMPLSRRRGALKDDEPSFIAFLKRYVAEHKKKVGLQDDPFEWMWFAFPTPFKRGDIVYLRNGKEEKRPFVLLDMPSWGEVELRENGYDDEKIAHGEYLLKRHRQVGDVTDMLVFGYFVDDFGRAYREHTLRGTYLDLEYYDNDLVGGNRFLSALSNYERHSISIDMLANAYRIIMDETRLEHIKSHMCCAYTDEQLRLAGIKNT